MKKAFFILLAFFAVHTVSAQVGGEDEVYLNGDTTDAKFQGGNLNKFYNFVLENLDKSKIEKEGQLICNFTIDETGKLKNIRIVKDLGGESAFEMIRVLRLSPQWEPAIRNGKPFATTLKIPFTFKRNLSETQKEKQVVQEYGDDKLYVAVEKPAEFPGGTIAFSQYFMKNFKTSKKLKGEIKILAAFIVNKDGSLSDVELLRLPKQLDDEKDEIVRIISNSPKWISGKQNGKIIRMKFTLPISLNFINN